MAIYEPGTVVGLTADIFPSSVTPHPPGWPGNTVKVRTLISERCLTMGWQVGNTIQRVDIEMTPEQTSEATFRGGEVGGYWIAQAGGCRCNSKLVLSWDPFPGVIWSQDPRVEKVIPNRSGLIPPRYSRA